MSKVELPPMRLSEIIKYMGCPEQARRASEKPSPSTHFAIGGVTIALMVELWLQGKELPEDPDEVARLALEAAITEELGRTGKISSSPTQLGIVQDRCAAIYYHFKNWWPTCGLTIIGCEVEIRSHHSVERGGRIDFLVRDEAGKIGIIDGKAFGVFGKSVSSQSIKPDLNRENQCGWYGAILEYGCTAFAGVSNKDRHTLTTDLKKDYAYVDLSMGIDFYGQIQYGHLLEFSRNGKTAVKGDKRGDILFTVPFHQHLVRNADALARWYSRNRAFPMDAPKVRRYEGQGKYTCDTCQFGKDCWPDAKTPMPVATLPSFVQDLI